MLNEILEYEKRLLEDREQLRRLVENSSANSAIEQDKLNFFRTELAYMNKQLELLSRQQAANVHMAGAIPAQQPVQAPVRQPVNQPIQVHQPMQQPVQQPVYQQVRQPIPPQMVRSNSEDLEKRFGKTIMGIVASVLIFISIILFATLLIPSLNNTIKMIVTYVVSFIICGIGWFKLHKNRQDRFFLALTGCGMGALYISLLLSNMYFKVIGDVLLYVLIAVWALGICVLSRYNNIVFQIIGHIGVVISMIFGTILCSVNQDVTKFIVLIVFYIVTSGVLYITHFKKRFFDNICAHISNVINLFVILVGAVFILDGRHFAFVIVLLFIMVHIVVSFISTWQQFEFAPGVILTFYEFIAAINIVGLVDNGYVSSIVIYAFAMALTMVMEFRYKGKSYAKNYLQISSIIISWVAIASYTDMLNHGLVPLLIMPLLLVGYWRRNNTFKISALILAYGYVFIYTGIHEAEWFVTGLIMLGIFYGLTYLCKEQYNVVYKSFVHVACVIFFLWTGASLLDLVVKDGFECFAIVYMIAALFNVIVAKSPLSNDRATGKKDMDVLCNVINAVMMTFGLICIHGDFDIVLHITVVLVTLGIFMINSKNMLDKYSNSFGGAYVGVKLTVFMIVLLWAYETTNYVVSIACFLFAVVSIVIGFVAKYKSLRVYGLVLCMISVFKLIVMDIRYANTLGYAISFFVAGVLCFAISLLYNYIDKRFKVTE